MSRLAHGQWRSRAISLFLQHKPVSFAEHRPDLSACPAVLSACSQSQAGSARVQGRLDSAGIKNEVTAFAVGDQNYPPSRPATEPAPWRSLKQIRIFLMFQK